MRITIVVPVFCEEKSINEFHRRLEQVTAALPAVQWTYMFVNDGSRDGTYGALEELARRDPKVKAISFARNFGKEVALSAGVQAAVGDAVICIDADLQHPPELIPEMVDSWRRGADVVVAVREGITRQPLLRRFGSFLYYRLMSRLSGMDVIPGTTDFRLLDKKVMQVFRMMTERIRLFRGLVDWMGFRKEYVYFHADARREGKSSFSYGRLWELALTSITSFSLLPLRLVAYLGMVITFGSGVLMLRMLWAKVFPGGLFFTPLAMVVVANTFLMGIVLASIGLLGFYIGTIHTEVVNRPLYIVRSRINFPSPDRRPETVDPVAVDREA